MKSTTIAIQTDAEITEQTLIDLCKQVNTNSLHHPLKGLVKEILTNPDKVIDTGTHHENRNRHDPCPKCDNEELLFTQTISDMYICTGEETLPNSGSNQLIENTVEITCTNCGKVIYSKPGFSE
jgi:ribosomal protein S27E